MAMTPLQMDMILKAGSRTLTHAEIAPTEMHKDQLTPLIAQGLVEGLNGYILLTSRGKAFLERVLDTPLPVQAWVFPDERKP